MSEPNDEQLGNIILALVRAREDHGLASDEIVAKVRAQLARNQHVKKKRIHQLCSRLLQQGHLVCAASDRKTYLAPAIPQRSATCPLPSERPLRSSLPIHSAATSPSLRVASAFLDHVPVGHSISMPLYEHPSHSSSLPMPYASMPLPLSPRPPVATANPLSLSETWETESVATSLSALEVATQPEEVQDEKQGISMDEFRSACLHNKELLGNLHVGTLHQAKACLLALELLTLPPHWQRMEKMVHSPVFSLARVQLHIVNHLPLPDWSPAACEALARFLYEYLALARAQE